MKKLLFVLISLMAAAIIIGGCAKEKKTDQTGQTSSEMYYVCPMHPEVVSKEPGLCPKCNMHLVHKDSISSGQMEHITDSAHAVYTCPMHPEVISDKPGVCPECNMDLELQKASSSDTLSLGDQSSVQQYTCGMHPQIVTNEPGLCPICNMKLVPKSGVTKSGGFATVDAKTQAKMGLAVSQTAYREITKSIRAYGKVAYSEPHMYTVNIKFPGWVEKLYVNQTGAKVTKGQSLLEIYSPELVAAQQEYLIAWRSMTMMHTEDSVPSRLVSAAIAKLKNWDITDEQIQQLALTKETKRTMVIYAPFDGVVTSKNVKLGDNVMPGTELFQLSELSTVWVTAFVYEQDFPFVKKGQRAEVSSPAFPGERFSSNIIYVSDFLDESRQAEIRLAIDNENSALKPNMYAEVNIQSRLPDKVLSVPRSAVIKTGTREIVFVAESSGEYRAREVATGRVGDDDMIEIKSGLHDGEFVVTSGQFLLDSESRLHEAVAGVGHTH